MNEINNETKDNLLNILNTGIVNFEAVVFTNERLVSWGKKFLNEFRNKNLTIYYRQGHNFYRWPNPYNDSRILLCDLSGFLLKPSPGNTQFEMLVDRYQSCYTNFTVSGSVPPDGQKNLITISLQLPYFISKDGIYGGKSPYKSIQNAIREKFFNPATGYWDKTTEQTESQIEKAIEDAPPSERKNYGIDCSGFVYYVLNEATKVNSEDDMKTGALYKQFNISYGNGVQASVLSGKNNGKHIEKAQDIVVGCTMQTDGGGHVLVVYKVDKNAKGEVTKIHYAHSNGSVGPHTGYIEIGDPSMDLGKDSPQTWHDIAYTDVGAKGLYNHTILLSSLYPFISTEDRNRLQIQ